MNFIQGDLLKLAEDGEFDIIVHGCNCFNTMGAGIAKQIRDRYPSAWEQDQQTESGNILKLGNFTSDMINDKFMIVNAYTQYGMSKVGEDVFEYTSFALILQKLNHLYGTKRFGFPMIGMGLAGGDKDTIISLLDWFSESVNEQGGSVTVVEYKP